MPARKLGPASGSARETRSAIVITLCAQPRLAARLMKVSYPLSLKVSLWLMLNLLLLAGVGIGWLVVQGGLGWNALVAGPSGDRMQALSNVMAGEVAASATTARTSILKRFGDAYNAEFYLFTLDGNQVAGTPVELPSRVRTRMEFRPPGTWPGSFRGGFGPRGGTNRRSRSESDAARRPERSTASPARPSAHSRWPTSDSR